MSLNRRIVITGASGWVGRALIHYLYSGNSPLYRESTKLFGSSASELALDGVPSLPIAPLSELVPSDLDDACVFHLAFLTKDKLDALQPRVFWETNQQIDTCLLEALSRSKPRTLFVASSGAAGLQRPDLYGQSKVRQENQFLAWAGDKGVPILCGRIFNISGRYLTKPETYAIGSFARQAVIDRKISIKSSVPTFRAYVDVMDICELAVAAADVSLSFARPIDFSGPRITELGEVAATVAETVGISPRDINRVEMDYETSNSYFGDPTEFICLCMRLGLRLKTFKQQVESTVSYLAPRFLQE